MNAIKTIGVLVVTAIGCVTGYLSGPLFAKYQASWTMPWQGTITAFREVESSLSSTDSIDRFASKYIESDKAALHMLHNQINAGTNTPIQFELGSSILPSDVKDMPEATRELKAVTLRVRISAMNRSFDDAVRAVRLGREYFRETILRAQLLLYFQDLERRATKAHVDAKFDLAASTVQFDDVKRRLESLKLIRANLASEDGGSRDPSLRLDEVMSLNDTNARFLSPARQLIALEVQASDLLEMTRKARLATVKAYAEQAIAQNFLPKFNTSDDSKALISVFLRNLDRSAGEESATDEQLILNLGRARIISDLVKLQVDASQPGTEIITSRSGLSTIRLTTLGGLIALMVALAIAFGPKRSFSVVDRLRRGLFEDRGSRPL